MSVKGIHISNSMPLGKIMGTITKNYYGALSKRMEPFGLDRHFATLVMIDLTKQKCTQQYLCEELNYDKVTMVRIIDYLLNKNFIKKVVNENDRREYIIQLTDKAKKLMPQIHNEIRELNTISFKGMSKKEADSFKLNIENVIKNLENLPVNKVDIKIKK